MVLYSKAARGGGEKDGEKSGPTLSEHESVRHSDSFSEVKAGPPTRAAYVFHTFGQLSAPCTVMLKIFVRHFLRWHEFVVPFGYDSQPFFAFFEFE